MWIILIKKLPTEISPPKLSIFWAVPWQGDRGEQVYQQGLMEAYCEDYNKDYYEEVGHSWRSWRERLKAALWQEVLDAIAKGDWEPPDIQNLNFSPLKIDMSLGNEANRAGAVAIQYKGEKIRVFPHEFSKIDDETLKHFIAESHEFMPGETPEGAALKSDLEVSPEKKDLYEAAILEGASESEAILLSAGLIQVEEGTEIKPAGWYRCKSEFAQVFCYENEMEDG